MASVAAALLLPIGLQAAEAAPPATAAQASQAATSQEAAKVDAKAHAKAKKRQPVECESTTTRIQRSKGEECAPASQPTRTYTKEDLDSTGQFDTGEALKRLDPRFH